jgi:hypothetical protein
VAMKAGRDVWYAEAAAEVLPPIARSSR